MKRMIMAVIAVFSLPVLSYAPSLAAVAVPDLPHAFYGTVTINGSPAPVGTQIKATGDGVSTGIAGNPFTTTVAGSYGGTGAVTPKLVVQGTNITMISFLVNGVTTGQTATWSSGQISSMDLILNTPPFAVNTGSVSGISTSSATLSGNLPQMAGNLSASVNFQWGLTVSYGSETPGQTMNTSGSFTALLSGLQPSTTYHYRAKATAGQVTVFGGDQILTTSATGGGGGIIIPTPTPTPIEGGERGGGGTATTQPPTGTATPLPVTISGNSGKGSIDGTGTVQEPVRVESQDGKVKLSIGKGTRVVDKDGKPLAGITGEPVPKAQAPVPPQGHVMVGQPMQFGPDGATFNPPLELVMSYSGETLPTGVTDDRLIVSMWNGKTWEIVGGVVDPVAKTVTAAVSHFTLFALTVLPPPTALTVSPSAPAPQAPSATTVPSPTGAPVPVPSLAAEPSTPTGQAASNAGSGTGWPLIGGLVAAAALVFLVAVFIRKRSSR